MNSVACSLVILLYISYQCTANAEGSTTSSTPTTSVTAESDLAFIKLYIEKMDEKMDNFSVKVVELAEYINVSIGLVMQLTEEKTESLSVELPEHMNLSMGVTTEELHRAKKEIFEQVTVERQLAVNLISSVCNRTCDEGSLRENTTMEEVEVIMLNREDGSVNFTKNWAEYKVGFGNLQGEFWLGLEKLHLITTGKNYALRVNFGDFVGNVYQSSYSSIVVGPESGGYKLWISGYNTGSTGGDSLTHSAYGDRYKVNDMKFSTIDRDNDLDYGHNCAVDHGSGGGGWWWNSCGLTSPTGQYLTGGQFNSAGINWDSAMVDYSYKYMKLTLVQN